MYCFSNTRSWVLSNLTPETTRRTRFRIPRAAGDVVDPDWTAAFRMMMTCQSIPEIRLAPLCVAIWLERFGTKPKKLRENLLKL